MDFHPNGCFAFWCRIPCIEMMVKCVKVISLFFFSIISGGHYILFQMSPLIFIHDFFLNNSKAINQKIENPTSVRGNWNIYFIEKLHICLMIFVTSKTCEFFYQGKRREFVHKLIFSIFAGPGVGGGEEEYIRQKIFCFILPTSSYLFPLLQNYQFSKVGLIILFYFWRVSLFLAPY